jgi:hypothetical protein
MKKNPHLWRLLKDKKSKFTDQAIRPPHNYTLEALKALSENGFMFVQVIITNKWLDCKPTQDPEYNAKLQFIKEWYEERHPPTRVQDEPFDDFC